MAIVKLRGAWSDLKQTIVLEIHKQSSKTEEDVFIYKQPEEKNVSRKRSKIS